jgi:hypothetical protein
MRCRRQRLPGALRKNAYRDASLSGEFGQYAREQARILD